MEISFLDLKEKEVINVYSGQKLGHVMDVIFSSNGEIYGFVVPGDKKIFRKSEDLFIPLEKLKRIGSDVVLVGLQNGNTFSHVGEKRNSDSMFRGSVDFSEKDNGRKPQRLENSSNFSYSEKRMDESSFVRMKPLSSKKYK